MQNLRLVAVFVGALFFSVASVAGETRLDIAKFVDQMNSKYEKAGNDNNGLVTEGELPLAEMGIRAIRLKSLKALERTLEKCVFIQEGAYGQHINRGQQRKLVRKFGRRLWIHKNQLQLYKLAGYNYGYIIHNNCGLSIKHDGTFTVIQGGADD